MTPIYVESGVEKRPGVGLAGAGGWLPQALAEYDGFYVNVNSKLYAISLNAVPYGHFTAFDYLRHSQPSSQPPTLPVLL